MKHPRQLDVMMAQRILGHTIYHEKTGAVRERTLNGQSRPLRAYSTDIGAAWEVVEKLGITLVPIESGWFALVGRADRWSSPADFLSYLQRSDFATAGAAIGEKAPMTICLAALKALERRDVEADDVDLEPVSDVEKSLLQ